MNVMRAVRTLGLALPLLGLVGCGGPLDDTEEADSRQSAALVATNQGDANDTVRLAGKLQFGGSTHETADAASATGAVEDSQDPVPITPRDPQTSGTAKTSNPAHTGNPAVGSDSRLQTAEHNQAGLRR